MCLGKPSHVFIAILLVGSLLALSGCDILDPDEPVPSYLQLQEPDFESDYLKEGSESQNISNYWVYVNDNLIGVFEYPIEIPVLAKGDVKLEVLAGIKDNGISAQRRIYPFFQPYLNDSNAVLNPGLSSTFQPIFRYETNTTFKWKEDFESLSISLENGSNNAANVELYNGDEVFEGNGSAVVRLGSQRTRAFFTQAEYVELPKFGTDIYLEFDYKAGNEFTVGLRSLYSNGSGTDLDLVNINANSEWNKIYIDLTEFVSAEVNANLHLIYFYANYQGSGENRDIYLDNLKLIHF